MANDDNRWSDIKDTAEEKMQGFGERLGEDDEQATDEEMENHEELSDEDNAALQEEMAADGVEPDPNRARFGERLGDDEEIDSDANYDTEQT